ncbi:hypothetical protein PFISCL1PPCAC_12461, partial [Pristionchus fissidentatus]
AAESELRVHKNAKTNASHQRVLPCPLCNIGYHTLGAFVGHLRKSHKVTPMQVGITFRCDCGVETQSQTHSYCNALNFTIIRKGDEAGTEEELGNETVVQQGDATAAPGAAAPAAKGTSWLARAANTTGRKCDNCGSYFSSRSGWQMHRKSVCGMRCVECETVCKSADALRQHKKLQHGTAADAATAAKYTLECEECGVRFTNSSTLNAHLIVHSGESFPCTICGKDFPVEYKLHAHLRKTHGQLQRKD